MIKEITSFEQYEQFIDKFASDPQFSDPHFLFDPRNLYESLKHKDTYAYIVCEQSEITGLFVWLILDEANYIELMIGLSGSKASITEILEYIEKKHPGYQVDFVINPAHHIFREILSDRQANFAEEQVKMELMSVEPAESELEVVQLSADYETDYRKIHQDNVYWTADRILEAKDKFRVYLAKYENLVIGYLDITYGKEVDEPYYLWVDPDFKGKGYERALLLAAIRWNQSEKMMLLEDKSNIEMIKIFESVGFKMIEGQNSIYASYNIE